LRNSTLSGHHRPPGVLNAQMLVHSTDPCMTEPCSPGERLHRTPKVIFETG